MKQDKKFQTFLTQALLVAIIILLSSKMLGMYRAIRLELKLAEMENIVGQVKSGIQNYFYKQKLRGFTGSFPDELDFAIDLNACEPKMACFSEVISAPHHLQRWYKANDKMYFYDANNNGRYNDANTDIVWLYDRSIGSFTQSSPQPK